MGWYSLDSRVQTVPPRSVATLKLTMENRWLCDPRINLLSLFDCLSLLIIAYPQNGHVCCVLGRVHID